MPTKWTLKSQNLITYNLIPLNFKTFNLKTSIPMTHYSEMFEAYNCAELNDERVHHEVMKLLEE